MVRKEFIDVVTNTGMATLKECRRLMMNKDDDAITEFDLLQISTFDENRFAKVVSEKYGVTFIDLKNAKVASDTIKTLKKKSVIKYRAIPIQITNAKVTLATFDPTVIESKGQIGQELKKPVDFIITNLSSWRKLYSKVEDSVEDLLGTIVEVKSNATDEADVNIEDIGQDTVTYVNRILAEAFVKGVSDIHVEPYEKTFRIRFRLDGSLVTMFTPPKSMMLPVVSRLKIMASLDISEKRKPQDGRIKLQIGGKPIDYRVSSLPTLFGEKVVLRLLDQSNLQLRYDKAGL
jgi:type IV pilus assembly protein PilB